jgi:Universal stress protein family
MRSVGTSALAEMSREAEMVVVGCYGHGAIGRLFLGSVSSDLVRRASRPVAIIRDEDPLMPHPASSTYVDVHEIHTDVVVLPYL